MGFLEKLNHFVLKKRSCGFADSTYNELAVLYNEMMEWIKNNGYKPSGTSIEYYYSNPNVPEEEQVTRIEMPLL